MDRILVYAGAFLLVILMGWMEYKLQRKHEKRRQERLEPVVGAQRSQPDVCSPVLSPDGRSTTGHPERRENQDPLREKQDYCGIDPLSAAILYGSYHGPFGIALMPFPEQQEFSHVHESSEGCSDATPSDPQADCSSPDNGDTQ